MKVKEAMHEGCSWCAPDMPIAEVAKMMREQDIGCMPVGENDRLIGMVTDRDICCRGVAEGDGMVSMTARDVMSDCLDWCWAEDDMDEVVQKMEEQQVRRIPVMDSDKRLVGILTLGDVSHHMARQRSGEFASSISAHH